MPQPQKHFNKQNYNFQGILSGKMEFLENEQKTLLVEAIDNSEIILGKDTKLLIVAFLKKSSGHLAKIKIKFEGEGAELLFLTFIVGTDSQQFLFETDSIHTLPNTKAKYLVKCAMFDQSYADYKGNLIIAQSAPMTDVYLAHHTLLLSPEAHSKSIPALEIEADEVKAGHAATLGKVDEELMFYLESRGISTKKAEKMLIDSFFEDQLALIENPELRTMVQKNILKAIPAHY